MLVCQDRECGHRKMYLVQQMLAVRNVKKLELRGEGAGQIFACKCGYRENYQHSKSDVKESGNKADKRDVQKYMKQQKKKKNH